MMGSNRIEIKQAERMKKIDIVCHALGLLD